MPMYLNTRSKAQNHALDDLTDQAVQWYALELAVGGNGHEAQ